MEIAQLIALEEGRAPAIGAPGRRPMSYEQLAALVAGAGEQLARAGLRDGDGVALAVPNGPEALAATLAVAGIATAAPLNPSFTEAEFRFCLEDLSARAVVVSGECASRAAAAARDLQVPVVHLVPQVDEAAGSFRLELPSPAAQRPELPTHPPGTGLLLHTSGTTARPKLVGLGRTALETSARGIAASLGLGPSDVSLNVMPLFHVHGLIGAALSTIASGGLVWCTGGFNALRFARWLEECSPTWYTAVPSMHQAILGRTRSDRPPPRDPAGGRSALRFIRSCSSSLPSAVEDGLMARFEVPVVNAYGMTEATHQVACTPLTRAGARRAEGGPDRTAPRGSVGLPTGPEVRVLGGGEGGWLPAGVPGEILLRGDTVISAYERPLEANSTSFHDGWLRTGDEGFVDVDGFVTLTGRLKELINSAGEKISPYEVEDALLRHRAVAEAVCFGIPHATRGEVAGAAVVLVEGEQADERALRRFLSGRLAPSKIPLRVLVLPGLPKGPTGKLRRVGLAAVLCNER